MVKTYIPNLGFIRKELAIYDAQFPEFHPIYLNRRNIVKDFLKTDGAHLLMIDHDVIPVKDPRELAELDLDIVGCPTPLFTNGQLRWNVYKKPFPNMEYGSIKRMEKDLEEVDVIGTGCVLIARRVLEQVNDFHPILKDDDLKYGTDFGFCQKAKEKGFKIWAAWDYPCHHFKTVDLYEFRNDMPGR